MKIIQICGSCFWGNVEMQTFAISEALAQKGNDVFLICPQNSYFEKEKSKCGVNIYFIDFNKSHLFVLHSLTKAIKHLNPDVIHCHLSKDLGYIIFVLRYLRLKTPLIFTKCTITNISKKPLFYQYLYNKVDKIYATSQYVKNNMLTISAIKQEKIEVLYNGINLERYNPYIYNKNKERAKYLSCFQ